MNAQSRRLPLPKAKFWHQWNSQSLTVKLVMTVSVVVVVIVMIGTIFIMNVTRQQIAETSMTTAFYQTQLLKSRLMESMLNSSAPDHDLTALMTNVKREEFVSEANIFDEDGTIKFSTKAGLPGKTVTLSNAKSQRLTADQGITEFTEMNSSGQLRIIQPIRALKQCTNCHNTMPNAMIGGIELFVPLKPIYDRFIVNNFILFCMAFALILTAALFIRWVIHRIVKRPIEKLIRTMERAERGELDVRIGIREDPILGRVANSFNTMVQGIQHVQGKMEQQYQKELAQANRLASLGQYLSKISHEIKNPLAAISSALHALRSEFKSEDGKMIYTELTHQLERIERTVNNLLRFARQAPPNFEPCNVMRSIEHALESANHRIREQNIHVLIENKAPDRDIHADEGQLEQVFLNLFLNSIDAMQHGGTLSISIDYCYPGNIAELGDALPGLRICVEDTGTGIDANAKNHVFEPFFTTKKGGTGLGLSVVKGIVIAHGGKIQIESQKNSGAKISLFFPNLRQNNGMPDRSLFAEQVSKGMLP